MGLRIPNRQSTSQSQRLAKQTYLRQSWTHGGSKTRFLRQYLSKKAIADKAAVEEIVQAYGGEIILTPAADDMQGAIDRANQLLMTLPLVSASQVLQS